MPGYIGQGLGKYFLQWTIDQAWSDLPDRRWLHTCTLTMPTPCPITQAGFSLDKEEMITRDIPGAASASQWASRPSVPGSIQATAAAGGKDLLNK